MALSYFINRKKKTCVITFKGSLSSNDVEGLEACLKESKQGDPKYFILNLGGLLDVEPNSARPFTLFQNGLREGAKLFLCDILPEPGKFLRSSGVVRDSEVVPDLMTCLQAILNAERE